MVIIEKAVKIFPAKRLFRQPTVEVLRDFSMEARSGEVTGLLGKNGAGKTTVFRLISGLESLSAGKILVPGVDPQRQRQQARGRVALLPENPGVFGSISGEDHLLQFGTMMGIELRPLRQRLEEINFQLSFEEFWKRQSRGYSRGQKMKIALARMRLAPQASVFIFDEPTNGLDFEAAATTRRFIRSLAEEGKTVIISSHILGDIQLLCDRIVGLEGGRQVSSETVARWMQEHQVSVEPGDLLGSEMEHRSRCEKRREERGNE